VSCEINLNCRITKCERLGRASDWLHPQQPGRYLLQEFAALGSPHRRSGSDNPSPAQTLDNLTARGLSSNDGLHRFSECLGTGSRPFLGLIYYISLDSWPVVATRQHRLPKRFRRYQNAFLASIESRRPACKLYLQRNKAENELDRTQRGAMESARCHTDRQIARNASLQRASSIWLRNASIGEPARAHTIAESVIQF
jgi:hypothetical protein